MFGNFGNFGNLEIPNFPKITKKWRSTRTSEITKYSFRLGNWPESSVKSSECRALLYIDVIKNVLHRLGKLWCFFVVISLRYDHPLRICRPWVDFTNILLKASSIHCSSVGRSLKSWGLHFKGLPTELQCILLSFYAHRSQKRKKRLTAA